MLERLSTCWLDFPSAKTFTASEVLDAIHRQHQVPYRKGPFAFDSNGSPSQGIGHGMEAIREAAQFKEGIDIGRSHWWREFPNRRQYQYLSWVDSQEQR